MACPFQTNDLTKYVNERQKQQFPIARYELFVLPLPYFVLHFIA